MEKHYYNEYDPSAAEWLRQLIALGEVPDGVVDERSITDVRPEDLDGFTQCHFFAGIGGWPLALKRCGVPPDRPLWTGSCPCQSFSVAGLRKGAEDERDLWGAFHALIRVRRPVRVLGEQVAAAVRHGWLDRLCADMEAEGYAVGAAVLGAHSAGADHIRQRLYWVADLNGDGRDQEGERVSPPRSDGAFRDGSTCRIPDPADDGSSPADGLRQTPEPQIEAGAERVGQSSGGCDAGRIPDAEHDGSSPGSGTGKGSEPTPPESEHARQPAGSGHTHKLADPAGGQRQQCRRTQGDGVQRPAGDGTIDRLEDTERLGRGGRNDGDQAGVRRALQAPRPGRAGGGVVGFTDGEGLEGNRPDKAEEGRHSERRPCEPPSPPDSDFSLAHADGERGRGGESRHGDAADARVTGEAGGGDFWSRAVPRLCLDGKWRRFEPRVFPLVARLPRGVGHGGDPRRQEYVNATAEARVMRLKGYGNALCVPTAEMFVRGVLDVLDGGACGEGISGRVPGDRGDLKLDQ